MWALGGGFGKRGCVLCVCLWCSWGLGRCVSEVQGLPRPLDRPRERRALNIQLNTTPPDHNDRCRRHRRLGMSKISTTVPRGAGGAREQCQQLAAEGIARMLKPLATWCTMSRTHLGVAGPYSSRTAGFTSELGDWESAGDVTHLGSSVPAPKWRNRSHVTNYVRAGWKTAVLCQVCVG